MYLVFFLSLECVLSFVMYILKYFEIFVLFFRNNKICDVNIYLF